MYVHICRSIRLVPSRVVDIKISPTFYIIPCQMNKLGDFLHVLSLGTESL